MSDLLDQHRRVMQTSVDIVGRLTPDRLDDPTPCAGWMLRDLLAHLVGQNHGFAAAARGRVGREAFADRPVTHEAVREYAASAADVLDGFATDGLLDGTIYLAEIRGGMELPAAMAIGFHFVDYVAHSWDVARALDVDVAFDEDVLQTALRVAEAVPTSSKSDDPETPFAPEVTVADTDLLGRVLALLGRDPAWTRG